MNVRFLELEDDNISYMKAYTDRISEEKLNVYWILSDVDIRYNDMSIETDILPLMNYYYRKFLNGEMIKLSNIELGLLLDNIYQFESGVLICFEDYVDCVDLYNNKPIVGDYYHPLPYAKNSLVEIVVFETNLHIYIKDDFCKIIGEI